MKIKIKSFFKLFYPHKKRQLALPLIFLCIGLFLLPQIGFLTSISEEAIIQLTNEERKKLGLNDLYANPLLKKAAYLKGQSIIEAQQFQHELNGRKFSSWIRDAGYNYSYTGENLAINFFTNEGAIKAWMESPTHKSNIINDKFTEIGVAVLEDNFNNEKTTLIVQIFGAPLVQLASLPTNTTPTRVEVINITSPPGMSLGVMQSSDAEIQPIKLVMGENGNNLLFAHSIGEENTNNYYLSGLNSVPNSNLPDKLISNNYSPTSQLMSISNDLLLINYIILMLLSIIFIIPGSFYYLKNYTIKKYTISNAANTNL